MAPVPSQGATTTRSLLTAKTTHARRTGISTPNPMGLYCPCLPQAMQTSMIWNHMLPHKKLESYGEEMCLQFQSKHHPDRDSHPLFLDVCHSKAFVVLRNRSLIPARGVGLCKNPIPSLHAEYAIFSQKTLAKNQQVTAPHKSDAHHRQTAQERCSRLYACERALPIKRTFLAPHEQ